MKSKQKKTIPKNNTSEKSIAGKKEVIHDSPVDEAFNEIKEMMYRNEIVPGQRLIYSEMAKKLNMSVTPIVQALNRLQLLNLVRWEKNKGYYVGKATPDEAKELFMAREALESFIIPTVIDKLTDKKIKTIENVMRDHSDAISVPLYRRALLVIDTNFHLAIIECAENKVFYNMSKLVLEQIYLKYRPEYMNDERLNKAAEEHRGILKALKARDSKKTINLLKKHIRSGSNHVVGSLWEDHS